MFSIPILPSIKIHSITKTSGIYFSRNNTVPFILEQVQFSSLFNSFYFWSVSLNFLNNIILNCFWRPDTCKLTESQNDHFDSVQLQLIYLLNLLSIHTSKNPINHIQYSMDMQTLKKVFVHKSTQFSFLMIFPMLNRSRLERIHF